MSNDIVAVKNELNISLAASLESAASIITKSYLDKLEDYEIVVPSEEDIDINIAECGQFYKLSKLVFNKEENFLDKLTTIVNVAFSIDSSLATIIKSDGSYIEYYIGIISKNYRRDAELDRGRRRASAKAFSGAVLGNLTGSDLHTLSEDEITSLQSKIFTDKSQAVSSISGVVALRDGDEKKIESYVQGIENLTDALRGQKYTILLVADPISSNEIQLIKQGYEMIYTQLASFLRSSVTFNESDTLSLSKSESEGVAHGISTGVAMTQSKSRSKGKFMSMNASVGVSMGITASVGISGGVNSSETDTNGRTTSQNESTQRTKSKTDTSTAGITQGKSLQLNYENRSVKAMLDKIDKHLERLEMCESFGAFDCAAYVIAEDREAALTVSSNYNALMRGEESSIQASHINSWHKEKDTSLLKQYLNSFVHPRFCAKGQNRTAEKIVVTPASIISGKEIAIQVGLPKKSVNGISVVQMAPFGRNVLAGDADKSVVLGNMYHMGQLDSAKVKLNIQSLASHTFITGSTGAGKSNSIYHILDELQKENVKFMIVEPAKGEYKHIFGNREDVNVFGTNNKLAPLLRINPFVFPEGIHVLEHIDRIIEIFNVCWPMYAAMPAVLKEAVEDAYVSCGWNLDSSSNKYKRNFYPTFADVMESLNKVISNSAYSEELKSNYKGSLLTRVRSLTNGLNGKIFCDGEIDNNILFDENTIIDISRVGSMETKAMIMGILVMRLQEYRMTQGGINLPLKHVTVLEEAHNLLKRTSTEQSLEGSNLLGKSVEMLANSIAEMRTYGEGFIIADQSPGLLDISVIRNTNTKIILRIPEFTDRQLVGLAAGMNDDQIVELAKLPVGVAAVYQNNWLEPVLCKMEKYNSPEENYRYSCDIDVRYKDSTRFKRELITLLLKGRLSENIEVDIDNLEKNLELSSLSTKNKIAVQYILEEYSRRNELTIWQNKYFSQLSKVVCDILDCGAVVENACNSVRSLEELTAVLEEIVKNELPACSDDLLLEACHCLMKEVSEENDEKLKLYYEWSQEIRRRAM